MKGTYKRTKEIREKISKALSGRSIPEETRKKMGKHLVGIPRTQEVKNKIKAKLVGHKITEITREKMRRAKLNNPTRHWLGKTRKDLAESFGGKNSHFWKGGVTPLNKIVRESVDYKLWRTAVFERDNYTCIWCGLKSGNGRSVELQADHIKPFALFPELRFAIDNGRTLCRKCHLTTHTFGGKSHKKYV